MLKLDRKREATRLMIEDSQQGMRNFKEMLEDRGEK